MVLASTASAFRRRNGSVLEARVEPPAAVRDREGKPVELVDQDPLARVGGPDPGHGSGTSVSWELISPLEA